MVLKGENDIQGHRNICLISDSLYRVLISLPVFDRQFSVCSLLISDIFWCPRLPTYFHDCLHCFCRFHALFLHVLCAFCSALLCLRDRFVIFVSSLLTPDVALRGFIFHSVCCESVSLSVHLRVEFWIYISSWTVTTTSR